jgi:hypothetical protein
MHLNAFIFTVMSLCATNEYSAEILENMIARQWTPSNGVASISRQLHRSITAYINVLCAELEGEKILLQVRELAHMYVVRICDPSICPNTLFQVPLSCKIFSCLQIAIKYKLGDVAIDFREHFIGRYTITRSEINSLERDVLKLLEFDISHPTMSEILELILTRTRQHHLNEHNTCIHQNLDSFYQQLAETCESLAFSAFSRGLSIFHPCKQALSTIHAAYVQICKDSVEFSVYEKCFFWSLRSAIQDENLSSLPATVSAAEGGNNF